MEEYKKLYNPVTRTYYKVRIKNTKNGNKGSIIGKWEDEHNTNNKQEVWSTAKSNSR